MRERIFSVEIDLFPFMLIFPHINSMGYELEKFEESLLGKVENSKNNTTKKFFKEIFNFLFQV